MKRFLTYLLLISSIQLFGQVDTIFYTTELNIDVTSIDFKNSKKELLDFMKRNDLSIQNQNESTTSIYLKINLSKDLYEQLDEKASSLGFVLSRKVTTVNNSLKVSDINLEISYLKSKKDSYTELMKQLDVKSDMYISLWNENKVTEEKIFRKEKELLPFIQKTQNYSVTITLSEEQTSPDNSKISFEKLQESLKGKFVLENVTVDTDRLPLFCFIKATGYSISNNLLLKPVFPYLETEFWNNGEKLDDTESIKVIKDLFEKKYKIQDLNL